MSDVRKDRAPAGARHRGLNLLALLSLLVALGGLILAALSPMRSMTLSPPSLAPDGWWQAEVAPPDWPWHLPREATAELAEFRLGSRLYPLGRSVTGFDIQYPYLETDPPTGPGFWLYDPANGYKAGTFDSTGSFSTGDPRILVRWQPAAGEAAAAEQSPSLRLRLDLDPALVWVAALSLLLAVAASVFAGPAEEARLWRDPGVWITAGLIALVVLGWLATPQIGKLSQDGQQYLTTTAEFITNGRIVTNNRRHVLGMLIAFATLPAGSLHGAFWLFLLLWIGTGIAGLALLRRVLRPGRIRIIAQAVFGLGFASFTVGHALLLTLLTEPPYMAFTVLATLTLTLLWLTPLERQGRTDLLMLATLALNYLALYLRPHWTLAWIAIMGLVFARYALAPAAGMKARVDRLLRPVMATTLCYALVALSYHLSVSLHGGGINPSFGTRTAFCTAAQELQAARPRLESLPPTPRTEALLAMLPVLQETVSIRAWRLLGHDADSCLHNVQITDLAVNALAAERGPDVPLYATDLAGFFSQSLLLIARDQAPAMIRRAFTQFGYAWIHASPERQSFSYEDDLMPALKAQYPDFADWIPDHIRFAGPLLPVLEMWRPGVNRILSSLGQVMAVVIPLGMAAGGLALGVAALRRRIRAHRPLLIATGFALLLWCCHVGLVALSHSFDVTRYLDTIQPLASLAAALGVAAALRLITGSAPAASPPAKVQAA